MNKRYQFNTEEERQKLILDNQSLYLLEEQNIKDGNFLVFSDTLPEPKVIYMNVPENELTSLKQQVETSQQAIDFLLMGGM